MSLFKQKPTMECPSCKNIEFCHIDSLLGQDKRTLEYKCNSCGEIGYFDDDNYKGLKFYSGMGKKDIRELEKWML